MNYWDRVLPITNVVYALIIKKKVVGGYVCSMKLSPSSELVVLRDSNVLRKIGPLVKAEVRRSCQ